MPSEKPILFSGPMVRAILDGRKTQTRRIVKQQPYRGAAGIWSVPRMTKRHVAGAQGENWMVNSPAMLECCPYGQPGDHLWVRETFLPCRHSGTACKPSEATYVCFRDGAQRFEKGGKTFEWTGENPPDWSDRKFSPSIHMPRWASRLTLEITAVRVEQVRAISEKDAAAEGCNVRTFRDGRGVESARLDFSRLWDEINGKGSWGANPWVWVLAFKVV